MATPRALLTQVELDSLRSHLLKHKSYPYTYVINRGITAANFPSTDASSLALRYYTLQFTPTVDTGIVSLATGILIKPETTFGMFGLQMSYKDTLNWTDNPTLVKPANEGNGVYGLITNGGAINDFQVFFPLDYFVRANETMYIHVYADATTIAAATSTMIGGIILGTFPLA